MRGESRNSEGAETAASSFEKPLSVFIDIKHTKSAHTILPLPRNPGCMKNNTRCTLNSLSHAQDGLGVGIFKISFLVPDQRSSKTVNRMIGRRTDRIVLNVSFFCFQTLQPRRHVRNLSDQDGYQLGPLVTGWECDPSPQILHPRLPRVVVGRTTSFSLHAVLCQPFLQ